MLSDHELVDRRRRVARWPWYLPVLVGFAFAGGSTLVRLPAAGALELGLAVVLGIFVREASFRTGVLLILPLVIQGLVVAAFASAGTFAIAVVAAAGLTVVNGLLAVAGVTIRQALYNYP